jgi:hypothetical protein
MRDDSKYNDGQLPLVQDSTEQLTPRSNMVPREEPVPGNWIKNVTRTEEGEEEDQDEGSIG